MPYYGSLHSPSLQKMENSRQQYGRRGINMGNIIGDPFALATISISAVSVLPCVCCCATAYAMPFPPLALLSAPNCQI